MRLKARQLLNYAVSCVSLTYVPAETVAEAAAWLAERGRSQSAAEKAEVEAAMEKWVRANRSHRAAMDMVLSAIETFQVHARRRPRKIRSA